LIGQRGGDGGLFAGILARYLALAALQLPSGEAASAARSLVLTSADACWAGAVEAPGGPMFSADWAKPAPALLIPTGNPARDLSVQLGAWLLFEAAATLT
jgi:predicted alpha-1,6-mannanase (GH76 family)